MRTDRQYIKRRQARAERRNARAKRRANEANTWPPNPEAEMAQTRLKRMFRGIYPLSPFQRMQNMERAQKIKMDAAWSGVEKPGLSGAEKRRKRKGGNPEGGPGQGGTQGAMRRLKEAIS